MSPLDAALSAIDAFPGTDDRSLLVKEARLGYRGRLQQMPEYRCWCSIKNRCFNPKQRNYARYGGRGITMCQRWKDSFDAFFQDVGPKPTIGHSIDRYPDNNGHYEPGNVRWATTAEQANNTRSNRRLTIDGKTQTVKEWSDQSGIQPGTIQFRLSAGWPPQAAAFTHAEIGSNQYGAGAGKRLIEKGGVIGSVAEWAKRTGIPVCTIAARILRGWEPARAISEPPRWRRK